MDRKALVLGALELYRAGDDAGFLGCFAEDVTIYGEPEIAQRPVARSRAELASWMTLWRGRATSEVTLDDVVERDETVVADLVVVDTNSGGGWRLAVRVAFQAELIEEVRLFWQRHAALGP